ncbi:MAG TPA: DUF402 domain-containing protein [Ktedonobacterales bacterium]|nr:DUF402 domain-containing protein [Ktedonobacterales bacterium]
MLVHKCALSGEILVTYAGEVAERTDTMVVVRTMWDRPDLELGYTTFVTGDRFTEYFYTDHYFNIMRLDVQGTGECKGWYCNIARPASIAGDVVTYEDWFLDVWVGNTGEILVLDEEEFAQAELDAVVRQQAREGLAEVIRWAQDGLGPFAGLHRR